MERNVELECKDIIEWIIFCDDVFIDTRSNTNNSDIYPKDENVEL